MGPSGSEDRQQGLGIVIVGAGTARNGYSLA